MEIIYLDMISINKCIYSSNNNENVVMKIEDTIKAETAVCYYKEIECNSLLAGYG